MRKITPEIDLEIIEQYTNGYKSLTYLGKLYEVHWSTIRNRLIANNIVRRENTRVYPLVENFFENIDDQFKAYWLGFITGDGCLKGRNSITIGLGIKDQHHLIKLKDLVCPTKKLSYYTQKSGVEEVRLDMQSAKMFKDLENLGLVRRKTFFTKFANIPEHLESHYIRGYFDADGCIGNYKNRHNSLDLRFSIVGIQSYLLDIQNRLVENCQVNSTKLVREHPERCEGIYSLVYGGNLQVNRIYKYLYKDSQIHLERKETIFNNGSLVQ